MIQLDSRLNLARFALVIAAIAGTSCEALIGLEDRKLATDGGNEQPMSELCDEYCDDVLANCNTAGIDAYTSRSDCLAVCKHLPAGGARPAKSTSNTVSCRAHYAREAASVEQDAMFCPAAAPGGGSRDAEDHCGDTCEGYCQLHSAICPDKEQTNCLEKCRALPDRGSFSASQDFMGGDTIQCRVAHLTAAAKALEAKDDSDRETHCEHALLRAGLGERDFCDLPKQTEPNCPDYCRLVMQACGDHRVFANTEQCMKVCGTYPKGTNTDAMGQQDTTGDTLACRRWHAYFAFDDQAQKHCPHAGPTGDGHCGATICGTYCSTLERSCKNVYEREFPGGAAGRTACQTACKMLRGSGDIDVGYDIDAEEAQTDTLQCRFRKLAEANTGGNACEMALPRGSCR